MAELWNISFNIAKGDPVLPDKCDGDGGRVCRACLTDGAEEYLFRGEELALRYRDCTGLHAQTGDGLPEYVCTNCFNKVNDFYEFRQNCLNAYSVVLREFNSTNSSCDRDVHKALKVEEDIQIEFENDAQSIDNFNSVHTSSEEKGLNIKSNEVKINCSTHKQKTRNYLYAKKVFKCDLCKKSFKSKGWLQNHLQFHAEKRDERLDHVMECKSANEKSTLTLVCPTCKRRFFKYSKFENHLRSHVGLPVTKLPCERCGKLLKSEKSLRMHTRLHDENRTNYCCEICKKHFRHLASFKIHQQIHNGSKRSICHVCGRFVQAQNMKVHLLRHTKERNYSCAICSKSFVLSIELKIHELRHEKVKNFTCTHCKKNFYTKRELDRHVTSHSDRKPYACNMCDKSFKSDSYLVVHKRSHTGERPYQCEFCEQTFKRGKELRSHRMRHTGERPYRCQHCDKAFIQKTPYNRHLQVHAENPASKKKLQETLRSSEQRVL